MTSRRLVFVVRIWLEDGRPSDDARQVAMVRGSIEEIDQERLYYFTSLKEAFIHIEEAIQATGLPADD